MKILKFNAKWCKECRVMEPMINELKIKYPECEVISYDIDNDEKIFNNNDVLGIPTFIFKDKDDNEILRLVGLQNKEEFENNIKININK